MPNFIWSQLFTANQQGFDPVSTWQYRYAPYRCAVTVFDRATTGGIRASFTSGAQTIKQRSPVQGGGTISITPTGFTTTPVQWIAEAGDLISLVHDEVLGGTPTLDGEIILDPV